MGANPHRLHSQASDHTMVLVAMVTHVGKKRNLDEAAATTYSKAEGKKRAPPSAAPDDSGDSDSD